MKQTGFYGQRLWAPDLVARGYGGRKHGSNSPLEWPTPTWSLKGSGGIVTTAGDLYQFAQALRGEQLLTQANKDKAYRAHVLLENSEVGTGYGWVVAPTPQKTFILRCSGAGDYGFHSNIWFQPQEDVFIAFLSNQPGPQGLRDVFMQAVKLALGEDP